MNYPIIADPDKKVAALYDMIHPNAIDNMTVRSVFVIGPDKKVKLTLTYPASCGRNFDELLRVIDSLQLTSKYKVATPANWKEGEDCIILPRSATRKRSSSSRKGSRPSSRISAIPRSRIGNHRIVPVPHRQKVRPHLLPVPLPGTDVPMPSLFLSIFLVQNYSFSWTEGCLLSNLTW